MIVMRDSEMRSGGYCEIEEIAVGLRLCDRFLKDLIMTCRESLGHIGRVCALIPRICIEPELDY